MILRLTTAKTLLLLSCLFAAPAFAQDLSNLKGKKPVTFSGGLNLQTGLYAINGMQARQPGATYILSGSPTVNIYGLSLPFSFTISNYQRDFRQPFNQFGLSPTYKWITVHAGYRNISYSQFAMAGYTLLGGGIELRPKKFRFALLYGRSQKAIKDDTSKHIETNLNGINYPAYKRMLLAAKIGYGTENNFIDLHFLSGKDDSSSLPFRPVTSQVMPAKNQVYGTTTKLSFLKKKLVWQAEGALSVYTRDIGFKNEDAGNGLVNTIVKPNITTQLYSAYETQLNYNATLYGLGLKYRRVAPDYKSMGAYYFQTDFEQYLGNGRISLWKSKLRLSASAGIQKDNLSRKKLATTQRNIYSGNVSFNPNAKFGVDINVSNFGTSQTSARSNLSDTAVINQINNSVTIAPRYLIVNEKYVTTWQVLAGRQALNDRNKKTAQFTEVQMVFANLIYMKTNSATNFTYNGGLNYNSSSTVSGTIDLSGVLAGVSKTWKEGRFSSDANASFNVSTFNGNYNGTTANFQVNGGYRPHKKHAFSISANALLNRSKSVEAGNSFEEYYVRLNYGFTL